MKKVLVIVLALCLVMGAAVAEATVHLDKLTLEFVPSKDADVIIAGTEGLPEMLQAALLEQGYEVDEIDITVGTIQQETVIGDSMRMNQALINLVSNALKYTPDGGSVRLSLSEGPSRRPGCGWSGGSPGRKRWSWPTGDGWSGCCATCCPTAASLGEGNCRCGERRRAARGW